MIKTYKVIDEAGLHARPASLLCQAASKFKNEIFLIFNDKKVTLKSILALMSLGIPNQSSFSIEVNGEGEQVIYKELENVLITHKII